MGKKYYLVTGTGAVLQAMDHITQLEEKVDQAKDLEKQLSEKFYDMEKQWNAVSAS